MSIVTKLTHTFVHTVCPVSNERTSETVTRLVAAQIFLLVTAFLWFGFAHQSWGEAIIIPSFLLADFFIRAFTTLKISPLFLLARWIKTHFSLADKVIDAAPKKFSAGVGVVFTLLISVSTLLGFTMLALVLSATLLVFAFLESAFAFCAGCYVYHFLISFDGFLNDRQ